MAFPKFTTNISTNKILDITWENLSYWKNGIKHSRNKLINGNHVTSIEGSCTKREEVRCHSKNKISKVVHRHDPCKSVTIEVKGFEDL